MGIHEDWDGGEPDLTVTMSVNQLDQYGKLIPWTMRTLGEIALCCVRMLGLRPVSIDLPGGIFPPLEWNGRDPWLGLEEVATLAGKKVYLDHQNGVHVE